MFECKTQAHRRSHRAQMLLATVALVGMAMLAGCRNDSSVSTSDSGSSELVVSADDRSHFSVHLVASQASDAMSYELTASDGSTLWMNPEALVRGEDVAGVEWSQTNQGRPALLLTLSDEAAATMYAASDQYVDGYLAFVWQGDAVFVPRVMSALSAQLMIFGSDDGMTHETLETIRTALMR